MYFQYNSVEPHFRHNIHLTKSLKSRNDAMNIHLYVFSTKKECKNLHKCKEISAFSPFFYSVFRRRRFASEDLSQQLLWNGPFVQDSKKKDKISNHVRVISPLQCLPTNRHPRFGSKGGRRALSQNEHKSLLPHTLHFISAEVSGVLLTDLVLSIRFKATRNTPQHLVTKRD